MANLFLLIFIYQIYCGYLNEDKHNSINRYLHNEKDLEYKAQLWGMPKCEQETVECQVKERPGRICFDIQDISKCLRKSKSSKIHKIQKELRRAIKELNKITKCFGKNIIMDMQRKFTEYLSEANYEVLNLISKFESDILTSSLRYNSQMLNQGLAIIEAVNSNLLDSISSSVTRANENIIRGIYGIPSTLSDADKALLKPAKKPIVLNIPLSNVLTLVNIETLELISTIQANISKATTAELQAFNQSIIANKNQFTESICEIVDKLKARVGGLTVKLTTNESKFIEALLSMHLRRLQAEIESIHYQIGLNIIFIVKGCNPSFRGSLQ